MLHLGWVDSFILYPWGDPREVAGHGAEFVAVAHDGSPVRRGAKTACIAEICTCSTLNHAHA